MKNAIDELITVDGDELGLAGSRCRNCAEVTFPALADCPVCVEPDVMHPFRLRGHGTLRDYVLAERGPEGFPVPYVQAWVKLDDGPVIYSNIDTDDPRGFAADLGTPLRMVLAQFSSGEDTFTGWKFAVDGVRHD